MNEYARKALEKIKARAASVRILVAGDLMLDRFLYGTVERISPEAPVPVVEVEREVKRPGGASNVALNILAMGGRASLAGVTGEDSAAAELEELLVKAGCGTNGLVADPGLRTTEKTRVIALHQQVVRFDREGGAPISSRAMELLVKAIGEEARGADAIIISDYGKGVVCDAISAAVRAAGLVCAVDPKPKNFDFYRGATVITPNTKETEEMTGIRPSTGEAALRAGTALMDRLGTESILVTRGEKGMTLVEKNGGYHHIPTRARDVFDVTGAGDTAISIYTLALACGADALEAAVLANLASGIVVGKLGTATVTVAELEDYLKKPENGDETLMESGNFRAEGR